MKPNVHSATSLSRVLPQVDRMANRLRRCAAMARTAGHPWTLPAAKERGPGLEWLPTATVAADALVATVHTPYGSARLAIAPLQWPALASAATLADAGQRRAVAILLAASRLGPLAALVSDIELGSGSMADVSSAGLALQVAAVRLDVLAVDDRLLAAIEAHVAELSPRLSIAARSRRLSSRILLASRGLPLGRLRTLRVGDVLVLPSGKPAEDGVDAWLSWGDGRAAQLRARVLLSDANMSLKNPPAVVGADENPEDGGVSVPTAGDLLSRLELAVGIELSGPTLRLADIADLKAGDVLELPVPVEQAQVRITVARQGWGLGELVAIGGRLGVRILRMDGDAADAGDAA